MEQLATTSSDLCCFPLSHLFRRTTCRPAYYCLDTITPGILVSLSSVQIGSDTFVQEYWFLWAKCVTGHSIASLMNVVIEDRLTR